MKSTDRTENLQYAGLNAVLLMGGYGVCGRIIVDNVASFIMTWLVSVAAGSIIWIIVSLMLSRRPITARSTGLSVAFSVYMIAAAGLYLNGFISLWQQWSLPNTSRIILAASASLLSVYGGSRGTRPVLRLCLPVGITVLILFLFDTALLVPEMTPARLKTVSTGFDPLALLWLTAALLLPLPMSFLSSNANKRNVYYCLVGILVGLEYLLLSVLRSVMALGHLAVLEPYPLPRTLMLVYMGPGLGRMEAGGLLVLSAAMLAAVMAYVAGAFSLIPVGQSKLAAKASVFVVLTAMGLF